ncbi:hypothetical protein QBC38DRAFT_480176 [Podospora fimiseda]|uniref:Uncharacterized protein n=1 Tax=Podospora fimiseda TaxID=252190 RepID=A0AAN7BNL5_9PEZI|nr:hypothetical protein QBC38DRAFT_480176 [Podospora fimiseda]
MFNPYYKTAPQYTPTSLPSYGPFSPSKIQANPATISFSTPIYSSRTTFGRRRDSSPNPSPRDTTVFCPQSGFQPIARVQIYYPYPTRDAFLSLLFPPLAVYLHTGVHWALLLNVFFCLLGIWPGTLHSFWILNEYPLSSIDLTVLSERNKRALWFAAGLGVIAWILGLRELMSFWRGITGEGALKWIVGGVGDGVRVGIGVVGEWIKAGVEGLTNLGQNLREWWGPWKRK